MFRLLLISVLASCLFSLSGCGPKPVSIEGRSPAKGLVTLDGEPLPGGGTVKFQSIENPRIRVSTSLDANGEFLVGDAPSGNVKMSVVTTPDCFPEQVSIPKKYSKLSTSGLEGTIAPDDDAFEIKLNSKP